MKTTFIIILAIILIGAGVYAFTADRTGSDINIDIDQNGVACTMDAKLCPDGSYVGRVPPSCQFALCPGQNATSTATTTSTTTGIAPQTMTGTVIVQ